MTFEYWPSPVNDRDPNNELVSNVVENPSQHISNIIEPSNISSSLTAANLTHYYPIVNITEDDPLPTIHSTPAKIISSDPKYSEAIQVICGGRKRSKINFKKSKNN